jgi:hypothetical protein
VVKQDLRVIQQQEKLRNSRKYFQKMIEKVQEAERADHARKMLSLDRGRAIGQESPKTEENITRDTDHRHTPKVPCFIPHG